MCSNILAMKWSNVTDFKWKSGNLVTLSCTVVMSNFHGGQSIVRKKSFKLFPTDVIF